MPTGAEPQQQEFTVQAQNYSKRSKSMEDILNDDISEQELSDAEVAILFIIAIAFVAVVVVLPIVLSLPPKS